MNAKCIKHTHVWKVNEKLVVASSLEDAIEIYKAYYEYPYNDIYEIERVTCGCDKTNTDVLYYSQYEDFLDTMEHDIEDDKTE